MKTIKTIWAFIAVGWLLWIGINLSLYMDSALSAAQASQLYDEASMNILRIIAITLLLILGNDRFDKPTEQVQQQTEVLAEQSKRITAGLERLENHLGISPGPEVSTPATQTEAEHSHSATLHQSEETSVTTLDHKLCPNCQVPMQIKTVTKGEHQGKQFYVCPNYKQCKQFFPVD